MKENQRAKKKMKKTLIFLVMAICLLSFVNAVEISPIFTGYNLKDITGIEKYIYDVEIDNNIIEKGYTICLVPKFDSPSVISIAKDDLKIVSDSKLILDKEDLLSKLDTLKESEYISIDKPTTVSLKKLNGELIETIEINEKGKLCKTIVNPLDNLNFKLGEDSVTIIGNATYNSTDNNVTQEATFSHLSVADNNIVAYYPFDINNTLEDYTTTNSDLINFGTGQTWKNNNTGVNFGYMSFNGSGGLKFIDTPDRFNLGVNMSAAFWIKHNATLSASTNIIIQVGNATGSTTAQNFWFNYNNGSIKFGRGNGTSLSSTDTPISIVPPDNNWYYITGVSNDTHITLYVNGVLNSSVTNLKNTLYDSSMNLTIGIGSTSSGTMNASIDEILIFNKSLTQTEISQLYNFTYPIYYPRGEMIFNITLNAMYTNVTLQNSQQTNGTYLAATMTEPYYNFTNNYISYMPVNSSRFELQFNPDTNKYFTPLLLGNISLTNYSKPIILSITVSPSTPNNITNTTVTGLGCPSELSCYLYINNTNVSNPNITIRALGSYYVIYNTSGNANYSAYTVNTTFTVGEYVPSTGTGNRSTLSATESLMLFFAGFLIIYGAITLLTGTVNTWTWIAILFGASAAVMILQSVL